MAIAVVALFVNAVRSTYAEEIEFAEVLCGPMWTVQR
jgi:hypothetical protein